MKNGFYQLRTERSKKSNTEKQLTYLEVFSAFKQLTSAHGIPHISNARGNLKQIVWSCVTAFCVGMLCTNFYNLTAAYFNYDVLIKQSVLQSSSLTFPAVTVCNTNPVKLSQLHLSPQLQAVLENADSSRRRRSITPSECPENETLFVYGRYCYTFSNQTHGMWDAESDCSSMGGHLLWFQDELEHVWFTSLLAGSYSYASNIRIYIGIYDSERNNVLEDHVTTAGEPITFFKFRPSQPSHTYETCTTVRSDRSGWTWGDTSCSGQFRYGCKFIHSDTFSESVEQSRFVCEGNSVHLTCAHGTFVHLKDVFYGKNGSSGNQCGATDNTVCSCAERCRFVANGLCERQQSCTIYANSSTFGVDPCPGDIKYLEVTYSCAAFNDTFATESTTHYSTEAEVVYREDFLLENDWSEVLAEIPEDLKRSLGYSYPEFVRSCKYNSQPCDTRQFEFFFDAIYGSCYVFNSGWNESTSVFRSWKGGSGNAFELILNLRQPEYVSRIGQSAGAVAVIHSQEKTGFPEDEGVFILPGHMSSIAVKKVEIKRLGGNYGTCVDPELVDFTRNVYEELYPTTHYNRNACLKTCYQKHVIETCGCADALYPRQGEAFKRNASVCNIRDVTQEGCVRQVSLRYVNDELQCDCPNPCRETLYRYTLSRTLWPADNNQQILSNDFANDMEYFSNYSQDPFYYRKNLLKLQVFFAELNYEYLQEFPKYPVTAYLADVGSVVGLWLGLTFLTISELLEILSDLLVLTCIKIYTRYKENVKTRGTQATSLSLGRATDTPASPHNKHVKSVNDGSLSRRGSALPCPTTAAQPRDDHFETIHEINPSDKPVSPRVKVRVAGKSRRPSYVYRREKRLKAKRSKQTAMTRVGT